MATIIHSPLEDGYDFFIIDSWNKVYHFKILSFEVPSGILSVAIETAEETNVFYPRKIEVLSDFDADIELAELKLKAKIKEEINRKSLKYSNDNCLEILNNTLLGEIIVEPNNINVNEPIFAVDGKKISIHQFCELLAPFNTFRFKFGIIDPCD